MNTAQAFIVGQINKGNEIMVFDWNKAAQLIKQYGVKEASAGLHSDWEYTGGTIFFDGKPVPQDETYVFLASTWAIPEIEINGEIIECYLVESQTDNWDAHTYWPKSALEILQQG